MLHILKGENERKRDKQERKQTKKKRKQFFLVAREALGRIWAASKAARAASGPSPGPIFSKLNEILPKLDRLVLGCIEEFLNFLFDSINSRNSNCEIQIIKHRTRYDWLSLLMINKPYMFAFRRNRRDMPHGSSRSRMATHGSNSRNKLL